MKVLITGIAGTGKSTIVKALNERGILAIDLHDVPGLMFWQNKVSKEKVEYSPIHSHEWFDTVDRICDIDKLKNILNEHEDIVVAGTAGDNQLEYFPLFNKIILLQSSPATLVHRMQTRINKSGYGKTKTEQDNNIEWQKEFDPFVLSKGAIPVNTEGEINKVVDKIIDLIK
jgi:broad-specificity NMP kinase